VSVKLSALGQALPSGGPGLATDNAARICARAALAGTTVTVDMEDHTTTDLTLDIVRELRRDWPETGAVLQAYLRRTEADCAALAGPGSRVRLCKGAYDEPASVAFRDRHEVDESFRRCLAALMAGRGYPMVATHDPALIADADQVAGAGRDFEFQMLYGVRPEEQRRLASAGRKLRVYLPYGSAWFPYFMRRLGERPANVMFFLRSFASRH
jgi:proline dehydrogenase